MNEIIIHLPKKYLTIHGVKNQLMNRLSIEYNFTRAQF